METHNSDGKRRLVELSKQELIALGVHFDRPPEELVFLTPADHNSLHKGGKKLSEETRERISATLRGKKLSEDHRAKLSAARKAYWEAKKSILFVATNYIHN